MRSGEKSLWKNLGSSGTPPFASTFVCAYTCREANTPTHTADRPPLFPPLFIFPSPCVRHLSTLLFRRRAHENIIFGNANNSEGGTKKKRREISSAVCTMFTLLTYCTFLVIIVHSFYKGKNCLINLESSRKYLSTQWYDTARLTFLLSFLERKIVFSFWL